MGNIYIEDFGQMSEECLNGDSINFNEKEINMKKKVLDCWQGKKAETIKIDRRITLSEGEGITRSVHAYGRSQCRTTFKRQDC